MKMLAWPNALGPLDFGPVPHWQTSLDQFQLLPSVPEKLELYRDESLKSSWVCMLFCHASRIRLVLLSSTISFHQGFMPTASK